MNATLKEKCDRNGLPEYASTKKTSIHNSQVRLTFPRVSTLHLLLLHKDIPDSASAGERGEISDPQNKNWRTSYQVCLHKHRSFAVVLFYEDN
jgi:hypothetical protein